MDSNDNHENAQVVQDLTDEELLFYQNWDRNLAVRPIEKINLEELTNLAEKKASRLRAMLDTGAVWIKGELYEWNDEPDPPDPICMFTNDPHVAAQFQMEYVNWLSPDKGHESFAVRWGENGAATLVSELVSKKGEKISVQLW